MQKKITLPSAEYLVVSVPKGVTEFKISDADLLYINKIYYGYVGRYAKIIGLASQIIEEQAKEIVCKISPPIIKDGYKNYYKSEPYWYWTTLESFHSLLKANQIYFENPFGDKPDPPVKWNDWDTSNDYHDELNKWQEVEANTSEEWLILKIEK